MCVHPSLHWLVCLCYACAQIALVNVLDQFLGAHKEVSRKSQFKSLRSALFWASSQLGLFRWQYCLLHHSALLESQRQC